jgi:hypothetical protein
LITSGTGAVLQAALLIREATITHQKEYAREQ